MLDGLPGEAQVRAAGVGHGLAGFRRSEILRRCPRQHGDPAAITANASTATVNFAGLAVRRSPDSYVLKVMLANGSVMTSSGWDTLSGPRWSAACWSTVAVTVAR
jgi:hypothetical protein